VFAVLISGAIRNLSQTWPNNKVMIDQIGKPYDVFVHTWDANFGTPRKVFKDANPNGLVFDFKERKYFEQSFQVTSDVVRRIIPKAHLQIETFLEVDVISEFRISHLSGKPYFQNLVNTVGMYQGISRVYRNALSAESASYYTNFVRLRTDFEITQPLFSEDFLNDIYFAGPGVDPGYGYVSDQFIISNKEFAEKISTSEEVLKNFVVENGWGEDSKTPFYGERVLSYVLKDIRKEALVISSPVKGLIKRSEIIASNKLPSRKYLWELIIYNFRSVQNAFIKFWVRFFR
jgi:hypothetical protein